MSRYWASVIGPAGQANNTAIASLIPSAAQGFKLVAVVLGMSNSGGAIVDFSIVVGLNRTNTRGTAGTTDIGTRADLDSGLASITGLDSNYSVPPTLGAQGPYWAYNSRGGIALNYQPWDLRASPLNYVSGGGFTFMQRSGAALPAGHSITLTVEWEE